MPSVYLEVGDVVEAQVMVGDHSCLGPVSFPRDRDRAPQRLNNLLRVGVVLGKPEVPAQL